MTDDLFRGLRDAARARRHDRDDARWRALTRGELPDDQAAALAEEGRTSPESARRYAAYRPLGEAFERRVAARIRARQRMASRDSAIHPLRLMLMAAVALLAIALAWQLARSIGGGPLPVYELVSIEGAQRDSRGDGSDRPSVPASASVPAFAADGRLRISLAPRQSLAAEDRVAVALYVESGEVFGAVPDARIEIGELGGIVIEGEVREILGPSPGVRALIVAVGRSRAMPSPGQIERALEADGPPAEAAWQLIVEEVRVQPGR